MIYTIGPASDSFEILKALAEAGMAVARLNFSHGNHEEHLHRIRLIKRLNARGRTRVKILQDLEGYRIRIGKFFGKKYLLLKKGQTLLLTNQKNGFDGSVVPLDYSGPLTDIATSSPIFIDDGNIVLVVKSRTKKLLKAKVIDPGILKERKGVNIPGLKLPFAGPTEKDKIDLELALSQGVEYIAQSFVRNKRDVVLLREKMNGRDRDVKVIAKIENREGIRNIDGILDVSDGIMIARGDMGVCVPIYEIPMIQKWIIKKCNARKKFVITATQMLENMTENLRPTRAEVTDVANAVLDGSDYLMLSGETAVGKFPVEAAQMMKRIIEFTEKKKGSSHL
ncbi:MAG: pyruvate kinase [Omnitrophica bacterium RIFCSPHIGHO2_02_FULL_51_18]|nr:MAG: pyruvate kinase [Omnitrophica bacterium RIFCSPHIGHO2_02_FULL_51_18]